MLRWPQSERARGRLLCSRSGLGSRGRSRLHELRAGSGLDSSSEQQIRLASGLGSGREQCEAAAGRLLSLFERMCFICPLIGTDTKEVADF